MIPIQQTSQGMVVFLECGCAALRHRTHPTGAAALVEIIRPCDVHVTEPERFRALLKDQRVTPFVRTPVSPDTL
jgi:hypothetical protein